VVKFGLNLNLAKDQGLSSHCPVNHLKN